MEELSNDQLIAVFGKNFEELKAQSTYNTRAVQGIEKLLDKRFKLDDERYLIRLDREDKKERRDKEPKEILFSKTAQKQLKVLDQSEKYNALLKEIKSTQKKESGGISKFLGPVLLLLGGIAGLAFGIEKIPALKRMFESFKKGSVISSLKNISSVFNKKGLELKEFIRSIPFVGRLIDAFDGFRLIAQGNVAKGLKMLAFAIPGAEFIAQFFGTSRQRLLGDYDKTTDKSKKFSMFGANFTFEEAFNNITTGMANVFEPVGEFFNKIGLLFVDLYKVATKGSQINFNDVINVLDKIQVYFPSLSRVTNILKMFAEKTFKFAAVRKTGEGNVEAVNIGDVFNEIFNEVSEKINMVVSTIVDIFGALGDMFSNNVSKVRRGYGVLYKYAPGLADGLLAIRNVLDKLKNINEAKGIFAKTAAIYSALSDSADKYKPEATLDEINQHTLDSVQSFTSWRKRLSKKVEDTKKKIWEEENPQLKILQDTAVTGVGGAGIGAATGAVMSMVPGTPFFMKPTAAAGVGAAATGATAGMTAFISGEIKEFLKNLGSTREERIAKLEDEQEKTKDQIQKLRQNALDETKQRAVEKDKPVETNLNDVRVKSAEHETTQKKQLEELKLVNDRLEKQQKFNEAVFKSQQDFYRNLGDLHASALNRQGNVVVNNSSSNFVLTDKSITNSEYRAKMMRA